MYQDDELDWEIIDINPLRLLQCLKDEANTLFQCHEYEKAIQKYTKAIEKELDLQESMETKYENIQKELIFIRLNRAFAYLKLKEYDHAECDCTYILNKDSKCIKALYRRALARDGMMKYKESWEDLYQLGKIEPQNAEAQELRSRVLLKLNQKSNHKGDTDKSGTVCSPAAEKVWKTLQDDEARLQSKFQQTKRLGKSKDIITPLTSQNISVPIVHNHELKQKTDHHWKCLEQEEGKILQAIHRCPVK